MTENTENHAPGKLNSPIAVLMNEYTFSAGEDFVDAMKTNTNAVFIGSNTAGSSGQPLCIPLESGGFFRICTMRCIAQNDEDIYIYIDSNNDNLIILQRAAKLTCFYFMLLYVKSQLNDDRE